MTSNKNNHSHNHITKHMKNQTMKNQTEFEQLTAAVSRVLFNEGFGSDDGTGKHEKLTQLMGKEFVDLLSNVLGFDRDNYSSWSYQIKSTPKKLVAIELVAIGAAMKRDQINKSNKFISSVDALDSVRITKVGKWYGDGSESNPATFEMLVAAN